MTHYQTLGLPSDSKPEAIRSAYRSLVGKHHPDKGGDPLIFNAVQEAYTVLSDAGARRAYDVAIKKKPVESLPATAALFVAEYFADC